MSKQKGSQPAYIPIPFTRAHSDRVRVNKKESRKNGVREGKNWRNEM